MTDTITLPRSVVEQALEAFEQLVRQHYKVRTEFDDRAKELRSALEQPQVEQEPVAWMYHYTDSDGDLNTWSSLRDPKKIHAHELSRLSAVTPLYTHPQNLNCKSTQARLATLWGYEKPQPQREPLTEADLYDIAGNYFADEWAQKQAVMMLKDHGIGGEK